MYPESPARDHPAIQVPSDVRSSSWGWRLFALGPSSVLLFFTTSSFSLRKFFIFLPGLILRGSGSDGWSAFLISLSALSNAVPKVIFHLKACRRHLGLAWLLRSHILGAFRWNTGKCSTTDAPWALDVSSQGLCGQHPHQRHTSDLGTHFTQTSYTGGWRQQVLSKVK